MPEKMLNNPEVSNEAKKTNIREEVRQAWSVEKWVEKKMKEKKYEDVVKGSKELRRSGMTTDAIVNKIAIPLLKVDNKSWMRLFKELIRYIPAYDIIRWILRNTTWINKRKMIEWIFGGVASRDIPYGVLLGKTGNMILEESKRSFNYAHVLEFASKIQRPEIIENVINNMPENMISDDRNKIWVIKMLLRTRIKPTPVNRVGYIIKKMVLDTQKKLEKNEIKRETMEKLAQLYSEINKRYPNTVDGIDKAIKDMENKIKKEIDDLEASIDKAYDNNPGGKSGLD